MSPTHTRLLRGTAVVGMLILLAAIGAWMLQASIPRTITIATGPAGSQYSAFAARYRATLARDGVTLVERGSKGVAENARLIADPGSGVDVAFMHGGVMRKPDRVVMLAALYYEPLWVFTRGPRTLDRLDELRYRKIAIGHPEEGVKPFIEPLLAANNLTGFNTTLDPIGGVEALRALQQGRVDAAMFVGGVHAPAIFQALHDRDLKLMNFRRAAAYQRRFDHITRLVLPMGVVDFGLDLPPEDVTLISTEAMLVARDDLPPALINLLLEAAAVRIRVPASHASEAYTLREHVALVRRAIDVRQQVTGNR
ncbi:MAG: hypothetical protein HS109_03870 [Burkholderiales bacterium]|nr:hypothetical protein [Burkholderiales bacterium]